MSSPRRLQAWHRGAALAAAVFAFRSGPLVSGCTEIVSGRGGPMKGTRGNALIPAECAPRPAAASRAAPHAARCSAVNCAPRADRPPAMTITAAYERAVRWPWYRWRCSSSVQALRLRSHARRIRSVVTVRCCVICHRWNTIIAASDAASYDFGSAHPRSLLGSAKFVANGEPSQYRASL